MIANGNRCYERICTARELRVGDLAIQSGIIVVPRNTNTLSVCKQKEASY